jgi:hypothetical protein
MSQNIAGFGLTITLLASQTYPVGTVLTNLAEGTDPFDVPEQEIAQAVMTANGELVYWTVCKPYEITLAVIPGSTSDELLAILLRNNTGGVNKSISNDVITMSWIYPNSLTAAGILSSGVITKGTPVTSMTSEGKQKPKTYTFMFQTLSGAIG